jgi:quercetin dioxygenase-like cupin family protein
MPVWKRRAPQREPWCGNSTSSYGGSVADFVIREWRLDPFPGNQAPLHVHHRGDEAFYVLDGMLDVQDGATRHRLEPGGLHVVTAGSPHTFATVGDTGASVLVVMTPEIDALVAALHSGQHADVVTLWERYHSSLA